MISMMDIFIRNIFYFNHTVYVCVCFVRKAALSCTELGLAGWWWGYLAWTKIPTKGHTSYYACFSECPLGLGAAHEVLCTSLKTCDGGEEAQAGLRAPADMSCRSLSVGLPHSPVSGVTAFCSGLPVS